MTEVSIRARVQRATQCAAADVAFFMFRSAPACSGRHPPFNALGILVK
jgi:hypothetical protein